jgi:predicted MFS family arabinose efflux permease
MQAGMLLGRAAFGGGALWIEARWGLAPVVAGVVVLLVTSLALLLLVDERSLPDAAREPESGRSRLPSFSRTLCEAFARPATWCGLVFALVGAAAFEATGALAGPLLVDRGIAQETIGLFFGLPAAALMLVGALAGGLLADRGRRRATLAGALVGVVASVVLLAALDAGGASSPRLLLAPLAVMYLFVGAFTAVSYALFMDLTDSRLGGTQFSTFMAATNGCEAWATAAGGALAARAGYPVALLALSAISLAALSLVPALKGSGNRSPGRPRAAA